MNCQHLSRQFSEGPCMRWINVSGSFSLYMVAERASKALIFQLKQCYRACSVSIKLLSKRIKAFLGAMESPYIKGQKKNGQVHCNEKVLSLYCCQRHPCKVNFIYCTYLYILHVSIKTNEGSKVECCRWGDTHLTIPKSNFFSPNFRGIVMCGEAFPCCIFRQIDREERSKSMQLKWSCAEQTFRPPTPFGPSRSESRSAFKQKSL